MGNKGSGPSTAEPAALGVAPTSDWIISSNSLLNQVIVEEPYRRQPQTDRGVGHPGPFVFRLPARRKAKNTHGADKESNILLRGFVHRSLQLEAETAVALQRAPVGKQCVWSPSKVLLNRQPAFRFMLQHASGRLRSAFPACPCRAAGHRASSEVWGIGGASAGKLAKLGVNTAADLAALEPDDARALMTVTGGRVVYELRGVSCLPLELLEPTRKGIAVTRSFGNPSGLLYTGEYTVRLRWR